MARAGKTAAGLLMASAACFGLAACQTPLAGPAAIIRYTQLGSCNVPNQDASASPGVYVVFEIDSIDNSQTGQIFNFDPKKLYVNGQAGEFIDASVTNDGVTYNTAAAAQSLFGARHVQPRAIPAGQQSGFPPASLGMVLDRNIDATAASRVNYFLVYNTNTPAGDPPIISLKLKGRRTRWPVTTSCSAINLQNGYNAYLAQYGFDNNARITNFSITPSSGAISVQNLTGAPVANVPSDVAVDPSGRFLYEAGSNLNAPATLPGIAPYVIDTTSGSLNLITAQHALPAGDAVSIAVDPSGKFAYLDTDQGVVVYNIDPTTGALSKLQGPIAMPVEGKIVMDGGASFLYILDMSSSGTVAVGQIDATTGLLTPSPSLTTNTGQGGADIVTDPSAEFLYVANRVSGAISGYAINNTTGALTAVPGSPFPAGIVPRKIAIDPSGGFVYVGGLSSTAETSAIGAYVINANGALKPAGVSTAPGSAVALIAPEATGRFIYEIGLGQYVTGYAINLATGALTPLSSAPGEVAARSVTAFTATGVHR